MLLHFSSVAIGTTLFCTLFALTILGPLLILAFFVLQPLAHTFMWWLFPLFFVSSCLLLLFSDVIFSPSMANILHGWSASLFTFVMISSIPLCFTFALEKKSSSVSPFFGKNSFVLFFPILWNKLCCGLQWRDWSLISIGCNVVPLVYFCSVLVLFFVF